MHRSHLTLDNRLSKYRSLQILNIINNECLSRFAWPACHSALAVCHIVVNVMLISFHRLLPYNMLAMLSALSGIILLFEKLCIQASAQVYEESSNFLEASKENEVNSGRRKIIKSFRPLVVRVGDFYFITVSTFTTFLVSVVDNSISVILAMK